MIEREGASGDEGERSPGIAFELSRLSRLAFPIAMTQLAAMSLGLVETAVVGKTSRLDLAGVSLARSILFALSAFGIGIAATLEPIASQALGAKEPDRAFFAFKNALRSAALLSVPTLLFSFLIIRSMTLFSIERTVVDSALRFLYGSAPSVYFFLAFGVGKSFLNARKSTVPALVATLVANVVNFVACHVLVRGDAALASFVGHGVSLGFPRLGSLGAGIAATISSGTLCGVLAWFTREEPTSTVNDAPSPYRLLALALPISLQVLAEIGVFSVAGLMSARLGEVVLSAHQVALGLVSFTFMGALGISAATSVRVGRAIGKGRSPRRAGLVGIATGGVVMLIGILAFTLFPERLVGLFTDDREVRELATSLVRIAAIFQFFDGIQVVSSGALRGAGDFRYPFLANVGAHWAVGFPVALYLGFACGGGARGIWWGLTSGLVVVALLLAVRFERLSRRPIARIEAPSRSDA